MDCDQVEAITPISFSELDVSPVPAYNLPQSIRTSDEAHWTTPTADLRLIASTRDTVTL